MKCFPADIISTGTPAGLAPLRAGDSATIEVGRIGELTNPVALPVAQGGGETSSPAVERSAVQSSVGKPVN
jgi:hypothetical protein